MVRTTFFAILVVVLVSSASATDRLVPSQYGTIQAAIGMAVKGDTVIVADGIYSGMGNQNITFSGKAITVRSENGPYFCIINCNSWIYGWSSNFGFIFQNSEDENSVLEGFSIINAHSYSGGAIQCQSHSSPVIRNCIIRHNTAMDSGGGIYCNYFSGPIIENCVISSNTATSGGGIYCYNNCNPIIINCTIIDNTAQNQGGGLYSDSWSGSDAAIINSIIWGNGPNQLAGEVTASFSDIQGSWPGDGNIDIDPCFAFADDYHLMPGSACIDAGTNTPASGLPISDLEGTTRPLDGDGDSSAVSDMGAYEYNDQAPAIAISGEPFSFFVQEGGENAAARMLSIRNSGSGTLAWLIDEECSWLEVNPNNGTSTGEVDDVELAIDANGLSHGQYSCIATVSDTLATNSPRVFIVTLNVNITLEVPSQYGTIQWAIDNAIDGDTVILAPGIYAGYGNRDINFRGKAITIRSLDPCDPGIVAATTIDCGGNINNNHFGFYFQSGEDETSVLSGLTITNAYTDNGGAAISCYRSSPTIRYCHLINNETRYQGGAIFCYSGSSPKIDHCVIMGNHAYGGGGISCWDPGSNPIITGCVISSNEATSDVGGGISCRTLSSPSIVNCIISNNISSGYYGYGGAVSCIDSDNTRITNCVIVDNKGINGGGVYSNSNYYDSSTISNCIIWHNSPEQLVGEVVVLYSNVQGGWTGDGNIAVDPCFAFANDYHLMPGSACIDAGTNDPYGGLMTQDGDGNLRPVDGNGDLNAVADMGVYEFIPDSPTIALSAGDICEIVVQEGDPDPNDLILSLRNSGTGTLQWNIDQESTWLEVGPTSGISTGEIDEITLHFNTAGLTRGEYLSVFSVTAPGASNTPRVILVKLRVVGFLHVPSEYDTIQAAINAAKEGDTVLIADGTYTDFGNCGFRYYGKPITVKSEHGPDHCIIDCNSLDNEAGVYFWYQEDANSVLDGLTITNAHVTFDEWGYGEGGSAIVCWGTSPTIRNCIIRGNTGTYGGGISCMERSSPGIFNCLICENTSVAFIMDAQINGGNGGGVHCAQGSSPTLTNCQIIENLSEVYGGGLYRGHYWGEPSYGTPTLINCLIMGNVASEHGGGIYSDGYQYPGAENDYGVCNITIRNCVIKNNYAAESGGGLYCIYEKNLVLSGTEVTGNQCRYDGAGLYCYQSSPEIRQCVISGNLAVYGGGICMRQCDSDSIIRNCTITGNSALTGGGLYCYSGNVTSITNSIVWGNLAGTGPEIALKANSAPSQLLITYSDVRGGPTAAYVQTGCSLSWGLGNINEYPLFVDPGYWNNNDTPNDPSDDFWVNGSYHLQSEGWRWTEEPIHNSHWLWDDATSRCIDAGNPGMVLMDEPLTIPEDPDNEWGLNQRINMGAYGGTAQASMAPHGWALLGDPTNDGTVNLEDYTYQAADWLVLDAEQPGDLNRSGRVDLCDLQLLVDDWLNKTSWH